VPRGRVRGPPWRPAATGMYDQFAPLGSIIIMQRERVRMNVTQLHPQRVGAPATLGRPLTVYPIPASPSLQTHRARDYVVASVCTVAPPHRRHPPNHRRWPWVGWPLPGERARVCPTTKRHRRARVRPTCGSEWAGSDGFLTSRNFLSSSETVYW